VFGMTRTTRTGYGKGAAMLVVEIPAAMEMRSCASPTAPFSSAKAASMCCGFTARSTVSAWRAAAALSDETAIRYAVLRCPSRSSRTSVTRMSSGRMRFAARIPRSRASAMLPPPINASRFEVVMRTSVWAL
jgi:hypothetical protein